MAHRTRSLAGSSRRTGGPLVPGATRRVLTVLVPFCALFLASASGHAAAKQSREGGARHKKFVSPTRAYSAEIPAGWHPNPDDARPEPWVFVFGPPEPLNGYRAGFDIRYYSYRYSPFSSAGGFIRKMRTASPDLNLRTSRVVSSKVGGLSAKRFRLSMVLFLGGHGRRGQPVKVWYDYVVVPLSRGFYSISYSATREKFKIYLPEFQHLLKTFRFARRRTKKPH